MNLFYCVDMKKLLAAFDKEIKKNSVFDTRRIFTEFAIRVMRKRYGARFTEKIEANFRDKALFE